MAHFHGSQRKIEPMRAFVVKVEAKEHKNVRSATEMGNANEQHECNRM